MILLVLVVVLWIVVLIPSAYRRYAERQGAGSVDHFHRQLDVLEHAGPKLVTPAYRLHTAVPGGGTVPQDDAGGAGGPPMPRAKLVLLRPVDDGQSADIDDSAGTHYERVGVLDPPEPPVSRGQTRAELQALRRQQARRRCSAMVRVLALLTVSTALLGLLPSLRLSWVFTGLAGLSLLGMVGLIAYAREVEAQRDRWNSRHQWAAGSDSLGSYQDQGHWADEDALVSRDQAQSGYPGAWDEEVEEDEEYLPRHAAAGN